MLSDAERFAIAGRFVDAEALFARAVVGSRAIESRLKYGRFLRRLNRLAHAKATFESALEIATEEGDVASAAQALANLGVIERHQKNPKTAEDHLHKALERIGAAEEHKALRAFIIGNIAHAYLDQGELEKAERLQREALTLQGTLGPEEDLANSYGLLGVILRRRHRWEEAEEAHRKGIEVSERLGGRGERTLAYNCGSLGLVLERLGRYEEASALHRRALQVNEKLLRDEGRSLNLGHLASTLVWLSQVDEGEEQNEAAFAINTRLGNPEGLAYNYAIRGR